MVSHKLQLKKYVINMDRNDALKEIDIKNRKFYYFNEIEDFFENIDNTLIDKISSKNILVYLISYKTLIDAKPLRIRFDKIDGFIRVYDGIRYLVLLGSEKYNFIYNRIRYLIGMKSEITYAMPHNYAKIKVDLYDSLSLEKTIIFHNAIILVKSVFYKDRNNS